MQRTRLPAGLEPASAEAGLARACEEHETLVWEAAHRACAGLPGNPLRAGALRVGSALATTLGAFDFASLNRVVGLGVAEPAGTAAFDALAGFYRNAHQASFRIEVAEGLADPALAGACRRAGLVGRPGAMAKLLLATGVPVEAPDPEVTVRELGVGDAETFASVNLAAWGLPAGVGPWFSAPVGAAGFRHFGALRDGEVVAVGAMYLGEGLAWIGFDAALRRYQARGLQRTLALHRIALARSLGCAAVHLETRSERSGGLNPVLRTALGVGFSYPYDRGYFEPAP